MARRGRGEGCIYFNEDEEVWIAIANLGYDEKGKRRRQYLRAKTKKEAQEKLVRLQAEALNGIVREPHRIRVADFLARWMEDTVRPAVRPATYSLYSFLVKNYINPHLGGVLLAKLAAVQIQGLQAVMERAGKSADMRRLVHIVLHRALDQAVQWELIPRNVCKSVKKPRIVKKAMRALDGAEVERLLAAAEGSRYYALFLMAVTTGMRQGELLALQWDDVDLKRGTVSVQHTLTRVDGKPVLGEPKTQASRRSVVLPAVAVTALREHRKALLAEGHPGPWVFCNRSGKPVNAGDLRTRRFKVLLQKAGLPTTVRFHDLRHTAATLLLAEGISPKVIQERLGHSNIGITLGTYAHCLPSMQQEAADRLDTFFERKGEALG